MVCLPLQGMAAVALPIGMAHESRTSAVEHASVPQVAGDMADHCKPAPDTAASPASDACDQCFSCHLSIAQALLPVPAVLHLAEFGVAHSLPPGDKIAVLAFPFFRPPISA
jgi:hypothetical protein